MFRKDHEQFKIWPSFSSAQDALANIKESEQELEKLHAEQRSLMIKEEWCEDYIVEQMHRLQTEYVSFSPGLYAEMLYNYKQHLELTEEDREHLQIFMTVIIEEFFGEEKDIQCTSIQEVGDFKGCRFGFLIHNQKYVYVDIPMYEHASVLDFRKMRYRLVVQESDTVLEILVTSYTKDAIKEELKKIIENLRKENN